MRHTMGQDWGGRRKENPEGCPRVTKKQVLTKAKELGIIVFRGTQYVNNPYIFKSDHGTWWRADPERKGGWITFGNTNYQALEFLRRLESERMK